MDSSNDSFSRRRAVGLVGAGMAGMAAGTATADPAQSRQNSAQSMNPAPPFQEQTQAWPGLAGKMNPRPDHGETRYRGSGRLAGRKELISGADSGMGHAAAIAYAREGADVAINYLCSLDGPCHADVQLRLVND